MTNPFTYRCYDLTTGTYIGKLPFQGVSFGVPQLNAPGPFAGSLPLGDRRVQALNWQACTQTGRTAVIVELAGAVVWGGILWTSNYQKSDQNKALKVAGNSFGSYIQQRLQAADYSTTWAAGADPMLIVQQIVSDALALGTIMGGITIVLHPAGGEGGPQITPSYAASSLQTVDSIVNTLSQMGYGAGFDYSIDVAYSSPGVPALTMNIWYPRQGRTADQTQLTVLAKNLIDFTYPVDSTSQATDITETGSGTGGVQPVEAVTTLPGYPRLQRTFSRTQINDQGTLGNIAGGDLELYAWPVITPTITLPLALPGMASAPGALALGSFSIGDDLIWKIDPLAGGGQNTEPRFPQGMDYEWRAIGWSANIAEVGVSTLTLNLAIPPGEGVAPQPPL